ncbi:hypothetical protein DL1_06530 [Thioclava dalianensis]|uniref:Zinc finger/thioredoxin putative domain-containing protein n=1 Tax=Thioclava dalianensis TaxID=1185766 RepID=A0A074TR53_9RHOB|nr:zinc-ribbon domain-containing protein [Thioclava dalianensis]KEP71448.1 hypothetical protein DL1_06530 [Thioclava dalianensis]SFM75396.1 MJ0042 family finger-like domain-containing protein [Thioclava dalianensis]
MRLVCPNCGAQYEVDDAVIPENGRDVQCSNCAHSWFQPSRAMIDTAAQTTTPAVSQDAWEAEPAPPTETPSRSEPAQDSAPAPGEDADEPAEEDADDAADDDLIVAPSEGDEAQSGLEAAAAPAHDAAPEADTVPKDAPPPQDADSFDEDLADDDSPLGAAPTPGKTPRRALDDNLLSVLREEAEREAAQRRAEGLSEMAVQDELGLEDTASSRQAPERPATQLAQQRRAVPDFSDLNDPDSEIEEDDRVADITGVEDDDPQPARGHKRLPNIDEINDSLTATSDRAGEAIAESSPEMMARRRSGFSMGFTAVVLLAAILALIYSFAPQLAHHLPAAEDTLAIYVSLVDQGRIWLNDHMTALTETLQGSSAKQ